MLPQTSTKEKTPREEVTTHGIPAKIHKAEEHNDFRILRDILDNQIIVCVNRLGHRRDIYD